MHLEQRWESNTRYYAARLHTDLLGDLVVTSFWGGKSSRRGGIRNIMVATWREGLDTLKSISKTRLRHGYREVMCVPSNK